MKCIPGSEIRFSAISKQRYPVGASPGEITQHQLDCTFVLQSLLDAQYQTDHSLLLGEVQFAFVCFLVGQVYDGFEQWKRLVKLLCSCESAISKYPQLYLQFITLLHYHVREIPEDFFVDIVSSDNFLVSVLRSLFENLQDSQADSKLKSRGLKFKEHLEKKFNWDLNVDTDEDAPVIVE
jgi:A1 cistron-splicing factor AAR2